VRIPASACNVFALRPSYGRFPTMGHRSGEYRSFVVLDSRTTVLIRFPLARSLDRSFLFTGDDMI
jgi:hypothetical protein